MLLPLGRSAGNCGPEPNSTVETANAFFVTSSVSMPPPSAIDPAGHCALSPDCVPALIVNADVTTANTPLNGPQTAATVILPAMPSLRALPPHPVGALLCPAGRSIRKSAPKVGAVADTFIVAGSDKPVPPPSAEYPAGQAAAALPVPGTATEPCATGADATELTASKSDAQTAKTVTAWLTESKFRTLAYQPLGAARVPSEMEDSSTPSMSGAVAATSMTLKKLVSTPPEMAMWPAGHEACRSVQSLTGDDGTLAWLIAIVVSISWAHAVACTASSNAKRSRMDLLMILPSKGRRSGKRRESQ